MQQEFSAIQNEVKFLFPSVENIEGVVNHKSFVPFDNLVCAFLNEVSRKLLADSEAKAYPDVVTFAFFCRKANVEQMKRVYDGRVQGGVGRGVTFHIAPSNVPINFAYTLVAGLLAGNRCIVRASSKDFAQTRIVCKAFCSVAERPEYGDVKNIFSVVMFDHSAKVMDFFSSICDIRVIWGGDNTIAEIRKSPLQPRATEITFADRYSFAVFDAGYVASLSDDEMKKVAQAFYNDTYLYDQNACSSPRLIVWIGNKELCCKAKEKFWNAVHDNISSKYSLASILSVDKLTAQYKCAVELDAVKTEQFQDNLVTRVLLKELPENLNEYTCAGGFYLEYDTENLANIVPVVTRKFQTLSYLGVDAAELRNFVVQNGLSGIDRIVPVGKTADFSLVWDGYDLIGAMSRAVSVA
jgi:hypothetical protein